MDSGENASKDHMIYSNTIMLFVSTLSRPSIDLRGIRGMEIHGIEPSPPEQMHPSVRLENVSQPFGPWVAANRQSMSMRKCHEMAHETSTPTWERPRDRWSPAKIKDSKLWSIGSRKRKSLSIQKKGQHQKT